MLMTREQYRDFIEAKFAEFIRPRIAKEIAEKTRRLIGSSTPLRSDHPEWGLALRLFRWDRAVFAKEMGPKKSSKKMLPLSGGSNIGIAPDGTGPAMTPAKARDGTTKQIK